MKKEYVLGFLFDSCRQHVWLIKKSRPAWQAGKLNGIGGKIEQGEAPIDAMVREFAEETGVKITESNWRLFCVMEGGDWKVHCYVTFGDYHLPIENPTDESVDLYKVNELAHWWIAIPNLTWLVPLALDLDKPVAMVTQD